MYQKEGHKYYYPKRNSMNDQIKAKIFLRNQILTGIFIDWVHFFGGGKYKALNNFC